MSEQKTDRFVIWDDWSPQEGTAVVIVKRLNEGFHMMCGQQTHRRLARLLVGFLFALLAMPPVSGQFLECMCPTNPIECDGKCTCGEWCYVQIPMPTKPKLNPFAKKLGDLSSLEEFRRHNEEFRTFLEKHRNRAEENRREENIYPPSVGYREMIKEYHHGIDQYRRNFDLFRQKRAQLR